jgi:hypothetical protein
MDTYECGGCKQRLTSEKFTKTQIKRITKDGWGRCMDCVSANGTVEWHVYVAKHITDCTFGGSPEQPVKPRQPYSLPRSMARLLVSFDMSNKTLASYYCGVIDEIGRQVGENGRNGPASNRLEVL